MTNIICAKWGDKYSADYVNRLYSMTCRNMPIPFKFYCYTDDTSGIDSDIETLEITSELEGFWPKLDVINIFDEGDNIFFDLDVVILNPLDRLCSVKTRTLSVLYSQWKEGYLAPRAREKYPTLYNSSIMKWSGDQGKEVYDFYKKHTDMIKFKYSGIDRYLFNERVQVDLLPTSIAYSYWEGVRFMKDTTPEKLREDYEVCILNHGPKNEEVDSWIQKYWH